MKEIQREKDASFGIIPLQFIKGSWQVFIVQSITGHWGFPKGHAKDNETPHESAQRELREETGLRVTAYYDAPSLEFSYDCRSHGKYVDKTVTLYLAQVTGNIHLCPVEILEGVWINLESVQDHIVFEPIQLLLKNLQEIVATF